MESRTSQIQAVIIPENINEQRFDNRKTGKGALAEKIIEQAKENKIPVHQDDKLADTLSRLEIGEMIPPELYEVVAEILVFVDAMDKIKAKDKTRR